MGVLLDEHGSNTADFALNRVAFCLFVSSFSLVVFLWAEQYHKTYIGRAEEKGALPRAKWAFIGCNAAVYIFQVVMIILWAVSPGEKREGDLLYDWNVVIIVAINFILAVAFGLYGWRVYRQRSTSGDDSPESLFELKIVAIATVVFLLMFFLRVVMLSYRLVTKKFLPLAVFRIFGYYLPEAIPCIIQLILTRRQRKRSSQREHFIADLYKESETDVSYQVRFGKDDHVPDAGVLYAEEEDEERHLLADEASGSPTEAGRVPMYGAVNSEEIHAWKDGGQPSLIPYDGD